MYIIIWGLFFLTSVYGHVGFKIVAENLHGGVTLPSLITGLRSFYGLTSIISWILSAILWIKILSMDSLYFANAFSSLRYLFVGIAAACFFNEVVSSSQIAGLFLICAGLALLR